jgi:hypothetical protein
VLWRAALLQSFFNPSSIVIQSFFNPCSPSSILFHYAFDPARRYSAVSALAHLCSGVAEDAADARAAALIEK